MPEMDGFQMIQSLKQMPELNGNLIIAMTALSKSAMSKKGSLPKDVLLLNKPINHQQLKKCDK